MGMRQDRPLVSVVIPGYRCSRTIRQAIDSALIQDVPVEVIVVDDQSPDDLQRVLAEYREEERVRCFRNEKNSGAAASRNRGVKEARGEYVAFLDADDWWEPGKLSVQLKVMEEKHVVLSCTGRVLAKEDGTDTGRVIPVAEKITYRTLLRGNCINCSSAVLRTETAREFPMEFDEAHEDYILWLKILRRYGEAAGIPEPLLHYRMVEGSKSGSKLKSAGMTYKVYRHMGYGPVRSAAFFTAYAVNGVRKWFL